MEDISLQMLGIILVTGIRPILVQHRTLGEIVSISKNRLKHGTYDIYCDGPFKVNDEPWCNALCHLMCLVVMVPFVKGFVHEP